MISEESEQKRQAFLAEFSRVEEIVMEMCEGHEDRANRAFFLAGMLSGAGLDDEAILVALRITIDGGLLED